MSVPESNMTLVQRLNSIFERFDFVTLRDALESGDTVAMTTELGDLSREVAESVDQDVVVEFVGDQPLIEGRLSFMRPRGILSDLKISFASSEKSELAIGARMTAT